MLCEKCNKEQATVHVTEIVPGPTGEMKKHDLCEACFSQTALAKKVKTRTAGWTNHGVGSTAEIFPPDEPSS